MGFARQTPSETARQSRVSGPRAIRAPLNETAWNRQLRVAALPLGTWRGERALVGPVGAAAGSEVGAAGLGFLGMTWKA